MTQSDRLIFGPGPSGRRPASGLVASVMWLGGLVATLAAMAVGAVLAVFAAAAVAVIAVFAAVLVFFAGALVFLAGLALRARRTLSVRRRRGDDVLEARKVDGTWVAYGWERPGR